jgi:peptide methionine sulfoxide reductase MsrB
MSDAPKKNYPVQIDEADLAAKLDPLSYDVLRNAATERPFTGQYTDEETVGSRLRQLRHRDLARADLFSL